MFSLGQFSARFEELAKQTLGGQNNEKGTPITKEDNSRRGESKTNV